MGNVVIGYMELRRVFSSRVIWLDFRKVFLVVNGKDVWEGIKISEKDIIIYLLYIF